MQQENSQTPKSICLHPLDIPIAKDYPHHINDLADRAAICLEKEPNKHKPGVTFSVDKRTNKTDSEELTYLLQWKLPAKIGLIKEDKAAAERGAIAIAFALLDDLTDYTPVEVSDIHTQNPELKTGIDYWLGYKPNTPSFKYDSANVARLEVSGILPDSKVEKKTRLTDKRKQVKSSDHTGLNAYIAIVSFKEPSAIFEEIIIAAKHG
jgi:hypothetical protein